MKATREIPLTRGLVVLVDLDDYEAVIAAGKWHPKPCRSGNVYAHRNVKRDGKWTTETLHHFLTGWARVDHANGNGLDNTRDNLRPASAAQNMQNLHRSHASSGFKGVSRSSKNPRRWAARITVDRKTQSLGYFDSPEEAAAVYDQAAVRLFGEFANTNYPNQG